MATLIDNFDSYSTGDLNGQGSWSGSANWDVQTSVAQSSPNAVACSVSVSDITKAITASPDGNQIFYIRASANPGGTNHSVRFNDSGGFQFGIFMNESGQIVATGSADADLLAWSTNTWYKIEVQWQTSDNTFRVNINDAGFTAWRSSSSAFTSIESITLRCATAGASTFYVDSFSDPSTETNLTFLQAAEDSSNLTTYTFSSQNLGTAAAGRYVLVGISARGVGTTRSVSSVTIGGVSATKAVETDNVTGGNTTVASLWSANVPTGTTGDVVVTFDSGMLRCGIGMWRTTSIGTTTPTDTATSQADAPTGNLDVGAGGFMIGVTYIAFDGAATDPTVYWTNIAERYDDEMTEVLNTYSGASSEYASAQTALVLTCTPNDTVQTGLCAGVFASWSQSSSANANFFMFMGPQPQV